MRKHKILYKINSIPFQNNELRNGNIKIPKRFILSFTIQQIYLIKINKDMKSKRLIDSVRESIWLLGLEVMSE